MIILITGGAGFIGSTLADKLLSDGNKVIVIDNFDDNYDIKLKEKNISHNLANPNYKLYRGDICDKKFINEVFKKEKPDVVVHLASCVSVRNSFKCPEKYLKTNILGTLNILEVMKNNNIKKIVFASSSSVYGNCRAEKFRENLKTYQPISIYAMTKLSCEQLLYTYCTNYNINTVCLRLFTVFGPRQRPDLAIRKFTQNILNNKPVEIYGDGTSCRNYTYIDDVISGICSAISYDKTPFEIINIGGDRSVTLNDVVKTISKVLNKEPKIKKLPKQIGDVERTVCDNSKAEKLLNYTPQTSFEDGIKNFIKWMENL